MARIRSIKPEMRTSITVSMWPREVRYFFVLLWGYFDDYGRGVDDELLIASDCFPRDRDITPERVDDWLMDAYIAAASAGAYQDTDITTCLPRHLSVFEAAARPVAPAA